MKQIKGFNLRCFSVALFCSFLMLAGNGYVAAQTGPEIVDEEYRPSEIRLIDKIRENIFATFGTFAKPTGNAKRNILHGTAGFDFSREKFQIYVEGAAWQQEINIRQKKRPHLNWRDATQADRSLPK